MPQDVQYHSRKTGHAYKLQNFGAYLKKGKVESVRSRVGKSWPEIDDAKVEINEKQEDTAGDNMDGATAERNPSATP